MGYSGRMLDQQMFTVLFRLATANSWTQLITVFLGVQLPYVTCAAAALYEWFMRARHEIPRSLVRIFVPGIVVWVFAWILKAWFFLPRPIIVLGIAPIISVNDQYGAFPSAHATFFSAMAVSIFFRNRRAGGLFFCVALVVAFARVAGGVHWPSDAVGGLLLGAVGAALGQLVFGWYDSRSPASVASGNVSEN